MLLYINKALSTQLEITVNFVCLHINGSPLDKTHFTSIIYLYIYTANLIRM